MWKVTLFKNTGINSVNTIDKPSRLYEYIPNSMYGAIAESIELPTLDILQAEFLSTVKVRATRNEVKDADFLMLKNTEDENEVFFYSIDSFTSTSVDVQTLSITFDALLTLSNMVGGVENIEFLDGIVERHHVNKADDIYGAYTEDDPLLIPSKELGLIAKQMFNPVYNAEGNPTDVIPKPIILATAELTDVNTTAKTYTDTVTAQSVTLPNPPGTVVTPTTFTMPMSDGSGNSYTNKAACCYDYDHSSVKLVLKYLKALGVERSSIAASYSLVQNFDFVGSPGQPGDFTMNGVYKEQPMLEDFAFEYDTDVKNKRVLYGNINKYEIVSVASGVRMEFKPEDLCTGDNNEKLSVPTICRTTDPRPEGRPYYNFKYYRGINQSRHDYFSNAVPGMQWPSVPIVYTGASGSYLNEIRYDTERAGSRLSAQQQIDSMNYNLGESRAQRTIGLASGGMNTIGNTISNPASAMSNITNYASQVFQASADQAFDATRAQFNKAQLEERYAYNAKKELQELKIGNTIVAPDVHFPNSETLRDFLGNGIYVIQYRPQPSDRRKLDKILTMYGYKDTKVLENSDFSGRLYFNYVKANSVSIGNKASSIPIPLWIRSAAATQIANGVRVWHKLPNVEAYNSTN